MGRDREYASDADRQRASQKAPKRRKPGRPPKNDQLVVDLAAAFVEVFLLGRQRARDLALFWFEGTTIPTDTEHMPRGAAGKAGDLVGHVLPTTLEARSETVRRKRLKPRPAVVAAYAQVLRELMANALTVQHLKGRK
jgi:hypothetical protein